VSDESPRCSGCGGELKRFEHRTPDEAKPKDQTVCFNGLKKADHICVAECVKVGTICLGCRLSQGGDRFEHHPERSDWIKRDGQYTRKGITG
jgi:hypothetical protein